MSLYTVDFDQVSQPEDLNQIVDVLQQPPGGQETGGYFIGGACYAANGYISTWISTLSRFSTPVSVAINTNVQNPTGNIGSPTAARLNANGFQVYAQFSAASLNGYCGGGYTVQF